MAIPKRFLNAVIVRIERKQLDEFNDFTGQVELIYEQDICCNRQTKIERNFGTQMDRFDRTGPQELSDQAFYFDLPADVDVRTTFKTGDFIVWRRIGSEVEIEGGEIRRIDINDGLLGAARSNVRFLVRGGDGSGA